MVCVIAFAEAPAEVSEFIEVSPSFGFELADFEEFGISGFCRCEDDVGEEDWESFWRSKVPSYHEDQSLEKKGLEDFEGS